MMNNLLSNKIKDIQNEYLILLKSYAGRFNSENYVFLVDEINLFWYKYRRLIQMFLESLDSSIDVFMLTGISYLDVKNKKHYPFVTIGELHIYDDPICSYSNSVELAKGTDFSKKLKEIILLIAEDNIKILENCSDNIIILPVRLLNQPNNDAIFKLANVAFLDMFTDDKLTIESYKKTYNTIEDIMVGLKPEAEEFVMLSDNDYNKKNLKERFEKAKKNNILPSEFLTTDADIFYSIVFSYLSQAIDVFTVCGYFKIIPYLICEVTYCYVTLIINSLGNEELEDISYKISLAFILNNIYDYNLIENIRFPEYVYKIKEYEFYSKVLRKTNGYNVFKNDTYINVSSIIKEEMIKMLM